MNKYKKPLLSIVIPTKDRYETLLPVIDCILSIDSNELELVIQDNSGDTALIKNFLTIQKDKRLKYFHKKEKLSQTENSDEAVKNAIGKYVCFIGDDDGVLPYIIDAVKWMERERIDILKGREPGYYWPGMPTTSTSGDKNGVLVNKKYSYRIEEIITSNALTYSLRKGGTSMALLPCLYHGIVSKKSLNKIYSRTKTFFPGPSPDMANGIALCLIEKDYTFVDFPIVISGKSNSSIGGQGVKHNHINHIDNVAHLPSSTSANWNDIIPKYWTGQTIWAESLLKSLEAFDEFRLIKKFNISYLISAIYLFHFNNRKKIFLNYKFKDISYFKFIYAFFELFKVRAKLYIKNRLVINNSKVIENVSGISTAVDVVNNNIEISKLPF